ncbi:MAG: 3-dehydroquinate synthase [Deltaproteobacteria bacterium]|jgi:shikimate kinase/3-dehydroquinate synthase|nr:3-dehydroquinate synthase [Deltaproteobacteria bacterium]
MVSASKAPCPWPVFLIGFMGTGKSTVGRALGGELGLPFIDLDKLIEQDAGKPISEIFDDDGEDQFRSLETAALARVAGAEPAVIATGGGAPTVLHNLELMRDAGLIVTLDASLDELARRVGEGESRPLWGEDVRALFERRAPSYRQAHAVVPTDGRGITEVGRAVIEVVECARKLEDETLARSCFVRLEQSLYPIVVDEGALATAGATIGSQLDGLSSVAIISDDNVEPLYGAPLRDSLAAAGIEVKATVTVAAGEPSKSLSEFGRLCGELVAAGLDRKSAVIALGGGVVGDLAGFVASSVYRGIRVVQVPTSLLAMVDSAIGGKTGINLESGKNLAGSFWQPQLVIADPEALATLDRRERRAAVGELCKYGLLDGEDLLVAIEGLVWGLGAEELPEDPGFREALAAVIRRCAMFKSWIVGRDEREQTGERALLNLGHTIGHAIEAAEGYGQLVHGEAVALGLLASCRVSAAVAGADPSLEDRVRAVLERAGLAVDIDSYLRDDVLERVKVDKKRTTAGVAFITVTRPGQCDIKLQSPAGIARILKG